MASGGNARQTVQAPAIGLLVAGILNVLAGLYHLSNALFSKAPDLSTLPADQRQIAEWTVMFAGPLGIVFSLLGLLFAGITIFAALKMKNLQSYGLAMTGSILAMVPCGCCCVTGIPIGIWSIIVLNKQEVKSAFS